MYFNDKDKEAFVVATITVLRWLLRVSSILQTTKNLLTLIQAGCQAISFRFLLSPTFIN